MYSSTCKVVLLLKFVVILCFSKISFANEGDTEQLRKWFSRAEAIASRPKSSESKLLRKKLKNYPLAPYVTLKTLRRFPYLSNQPQIDDFLTQYSGTPLDRPLRKVWLEYLAKEQQGKLFLQYYQDIGNVPLHCHWLRFRLQAGEDKEEILLAVNKLWLVGKSQPKACDPLFSVWKKAGKLTESLIYERLKLAANGGKHTLIPYLKKQLPSEKQYLADLWLKVRRSPSYVTKIQLFKNRFPELENEILIYGLRRLVWRDRDLALSAWQKLAKTRTFTELQELRVKERFAVALAVANHSEAGEWLDKAVATSQDIEVLRWQLAHVLRQRNWHKVNEVAERGYSVAQNEHVFQYWLARSFAELGKQKSADEHFSELAKQRHYYGFMSSAKLSKAPAMLDAAAQYGPDQLTEVRQHPAALRAFEFLQLKRLTNARREWRYLLTQLSAEQQTKAAVLADSWGWHDQAIRTFSYSGYLNDVKRRFPTAYSDSILKHAKAVKVEPEWAFAITRRESAFMPDANSSAGAKGLMQVMPNTAKYLEKKRVKNALLFKPDFNIELGTRYLRYLLGRMGNNPVLATASYNAGWRRVQNWLPKTNDVPFDVWVESIPYKETREYVKAVLTYKQIYAWQIDEGKSLFNKYAEMKVPTAKSL